MVRSQCHVTGCDSHSTKTYHYCAAHTKANADLRTQAERQLPCAANGNCPSKCRFRKVQWFCVAHVCEDGDCSNSKDGGDYCRAHTCFASDCLARQQRDGYCLDHHCAVDGCPNARQHGIYCLGHQPSTPRIEQCVKEKCEQPRYKKLKVCQQHRRCSDVSCKLETAGNAFVCTKHKCQNGACDEPIDAGKSSYCETHVCQGFMDKMRTVRCNIHRVYVPTRDGGEYLAYCPLHICRKALENGDRKICKKNNGNRVYCDDHRCTVTYCDGAKRGGTMDLVDLQIGQYCNLHAELDRRSALDTIREAYGVLRRVGQAARAQAERPPRGGPYGNGHMER